MLNSPGNYENKQRAVPFMSVRTLRDNDLALSQTTNLRLFQTERVCRRQFQIQ